MRPNTALDRKMEARWERLLDRRGGYRKKKSSRYTKPRAQYYKPRTRKMADLPKPVAPPVARARNPIFDAPTGEGPTPVWGRDGGWRWYPSVQVQDTFNSSVTGGAISGGTIEALERGLESYVGTLYNAETRHAIEGYIHSWSQEAGLRQIAMRGNRFTTASDTPTGDGIPVYHVNVQAGTSIGSFSITTRLYPANCDGVYTYEQPVPIWSEATTANFTLPDIAEVAVGFHAIGAAARNAAETIVRFTDNLGRSLRWPLLSPEEQRKDAFRKKIRQGLLAPEPRRGDTHLDALARTVSPAELTALEMLRGLLPEQEWKRYLKYGFVVVRGKSGLLYQVPRNGSHIRVWKRGQKIAELCIVIHGSVPPTDQVIGKKVLLEFSEAEVWHRANIHGHRQWGYQYKPSEQELAAQAAA